MVVFWPIGSIRAEWIYSVKVVVIGQIGCIWVKVFVFGQFGFIWAKLVVFGDSGCIRATWLYLGKKWFYLGILVVFGQN